MIRVQNCPTRFGPISWSTQAVAPSGGSVRWKVEVTFAKPFEADIHVHIHPPDRSPLHSASVGELHQSYIVVPATLLAGKTHVAIDVE